MKKIAFSLIALAAISTASFAGDNRGYDLRDSDTYFGKYSFQLKDKAASANALTVIKSDRAASNFERLKWISEENDQGGRH
jgi:hypothetical protein